MSDKEKWQIATKDAPAAIGPYSQAVRVGDTLFASGQVALDPATGQLVPGGVTEQTTRVLREREGGAGGGWAGSEHVVKTTVFLKSMGDFAAMNAVYESILLRREWFLRRGRRLRLRGCRRMRWSRSRSSQRG